mmetsp:Transcript_37218/g.59641  ORF Transcript_37218/g.59641 Transcript_37218/m.59641 type:complete len:224 (+) Transcript_37218:96-767(+)
MSTRFSSTNMSSSCCIIAKHALQSSISESFSSNSLSRATVFASSSSSAGGGSTNLAEQKIAMAAPIVPRSSIDSNSTSCQNLDRALQPMEEASSIVERILLCCRRRCLCCLCLVHASCLVDFAGLACSFLGHPCPFSLACLAASAVAAAALGFSRPCHLPWPCLCLSPLLLLSLSPEPEPHVFVALFPALAQPSAVALWPLPPPFAFGSPASYVAFLLPVAVF